jgi:hypothetical protein
MRLRTNLCLGLVVLRGILTECFEWRMGTNRTMWDVGDRRVTKGTMADLSLSNVVIISDCNRFYFFSALNAVKPQ